MSVSTELCGRCREAAAERAVEGAPLCEACLLALDVWLRPHVPRERRRWRRFGYAALVITTEWHYGRACTIAARKLGCEYWEVREGCASLETLERERRELGLDLEEKAEDQDRIG